MDSLKKVVKIMQYIEDNGKIIESKIIKKFGKNGYNKFSRYCLGGEEYYATSTFPHAKSNNFPGGFLSLNQKGVRKLYELRRILADEKRSEWIKWATISVGISAFLQIFFQFYSKEGLMFSLIFILIIIFLITILFLLYYLL